MKLRFLHHPIHPLMIHFPTALLPMGLVFDFIYFKTGQQSFGQAGFYCLAAGVIGGLLSMITGLLEILLIPKNSAALGTAIYHGTINAVVIAIFAALAWKTWEQYPAVAVTQSSLVFKTVLIVILFVGNYLGGKLIYHFKIGIEENQ
jgi:uncharacterized membrane protein